MSRYVADKVYYRNALHHEAKLASLRPGIKYKGITTVGGELCIFWNPFRSFYVNEWIREPDEFMYMGEGTVGPMRYTGGNAALTKAQQETRPVTVFYKVRRDGSEWLCLGHFNVIEVSEGVSEDDEGKLRADIRFRMLRQSQSPITTPVPALPPATTPPTYSEQQLWELVEKAVKQSGGHRSRVTRISKDKRTSNAALTEYVRQRAIDQGGTCESCGVPPGWLTDHGRPHFQAHHIDPDIDRADWIAAVCGTCHDRLHHGSDRAERAAQLRATVRARQVALGRPVFDLT